MWCVSVCMMVGRMSDPQSRSGGGHCHGITKGGDGEEKLGQ